MKRGIALLLLLSFGWIYAGACTSVIVSGKATSDGRPILWKHRDSDEFHNVIRYFSDGKYASIGLVNASDSAGESIWAGYNMAGFAIMNTASYNLTDKDTVTLKDREGILMRQALQICATVEEFVQFLKNVPKPMGVEANFGVIDARGGAAWFEVDHFSFKKLDVNDPAQAPFGYMIRTNFSFTGDPQRGSGHIRYKTAEDLFFQASRQNNLNVRFILQDVSRSLWHSLVKTDLKKMQVSPEDQKFVPFADFIPRYTSVASVAIQGVTVGEDPVFTTMWTILGFPLTSVVIPLWLNQGAAQPVLVTPGHDGLAPLCEKALVLKERLFPVIFNYKPGYINLSSLYNNDGTGIMQQLRPLEDTIFDLSLKKLENWRNDKDFREEIPAFYHELENLITGRYRSLFGI